MQAILAFPSLTSSTMQFSPLFLYLWLATIFSLLSLASAQQHPHHNHDRHSHHHHAQHQHPHHRLSSSHRHASKRAFGEAMRIWTPSQGPARRSADLKGRALEPFNEDASPGWTFGRVYDIPHWDGGDRAGCRTTQVSRNQSAASEESEFGASHKVSHRKRRGSPNAVGKRETDSDFCTHSNVAVETPDESTCKHEYGTVDIAEKLRKRIIPTFAQVEDIAIKGIEAGRDMYMSRVQAGMPGGLLEMLVGSSEASPNIKAPSSAISQLPSGTGASPSSPGSGALAGPAAVPRLTTPSSHTGDTKVPELIGGDHSSDAKSPGSNGLPTPGTPQGTLLNSSVKSKRHLTDIELRDADERQILSLVSAAFDTADEINAIPASHRENSDDGTNARLKRSSQQSGTDAATFALSLTRTLMPALLATIHATKKVGVALIHSEQQIQKEQIRHQNAHHMRNSKQKKWKGNKKARSASDESGAGSSDAAHLDSSSPADSSVPTWADLGSGQCRGTPQLCMALIESAFPYCHPDQHNVHVDLASAKAQHPDASVELIRAMVFHCTLKCARFAEFVKADHGFEAKLDKCTGVVHLLDKVESFADHLHLSAADSYKVEHSDKHVSHSAKKPPPPKRSLSTQCRSAYQALFTDAKRPVASHSNKLFGSVVSDPASFLHWGLVSSVSQCLQACDETSGCVFVNIYQQTFSLDNPNIKLFNRGLLDPTKIKESRGDEWERTEGMRLRSKFAGKREDKKNSFVQGQLTCALYSRCHALCDADHPSGGDEPVFFERSQGWCKSKACASNTA